jgi:helicase MOV-10
VIDEAGHATEPEALIPFAAVAQPRYERERERISFYSLSSSFSYLLLLPRVTRLILAGDPQQLGPVILSPLARQCGLELSMLERLAKWCPVYARKEGAKVKKRIKER